MGNVKFGNSGDIIEIKVRDSTGAVIENWKVNALDASLVNKMIDVLKRKYVNEKIEKKYDWLSADSEFLKF